MTNVSPRGLESNVAGGTLFIQVFNANGQPVSNAQITIDNITVNPQIHTQTLTDSNGILNLPGSPVCVTCYKISATKTGYSTDRTYSVTEVANPNQPYATVIDGRITQLSFAIDEVSAVTVKSYGSRAAGFPIVANAMFTLHGSKIIGTDTSDNPVYKYSYATNTGGGTVSIPGLEWDTYTLVFSNSYYDIAGSNPLNPFALAPKSNLTISVSTEPKTATSLLVAIKNIAGELQSSASAELTDMLSFSASKSAGATGSADFGQAFFGGLTAGVFNLKVTGNGYQEASASLNLTNTHMETVILTPVE